MFLEIAHAELRYARSRKPAVTDFSLSLAAGEIGVLIGPSGCGKTTLLRGVAGLELLQAGQIRLAGELVSSADHNLAPEQRRIGMVFQDYALFPHMDVATNLGFGLQGLDRGQRTLRIKEALELVGMEGAQKRFPHELSGGQQQRVALARALAPQPRLMLLDEPFSNLDEDLREHLAQEVRAILKAAGATALLVTHDQMEAFAIGDRIGVMDQGCLHQWDDAYTLYHRPATRFVADFIGHGVFIPGVIHQEQQQIVVRTPLGDLADIAECPLPDAYESGECDVLLRADDIVHDDAAPVRARILRKSFRGSEFLYTLQLESGQTVLAHVPSHHDHQLGEWIGIRAEVDHVVTFARRKTTESEETLKAKTARSSDR